MQAWLIQLYYRFTTYQAGLVKRSLTVNQDGTAVFSYCERGSKSEGQPTIVFVHGLSSNKETWLPIVKNIPDDYHCITVDLPAHGETVGLNEEHYSIDKFVDALKLFFDKKHLTDPMCIIGASMGGAIVSMFAVKYPSYVSMICLLAPPANEQCETNLIQQLRSGVYSALLPETPEQLYAMINTLTVKKISLPRPFLNGFLHLRLRLLEEHRKVLSSLLEYDYSHLEEYYQKLRQMDKPALILWDRQDRVYAAEGAEYFAKLLPMAEKDVFEDCGHFMAIDKPEETAQSIVTFLNSHSNYILCIKWVNILGTPGSRKIPPSPFEIMWHEKRERAMSSTYILGQASDFYFLCRNGEIDKVRQAIDAENAPSIDQLNELQPNGSTALHAATYYEHRDTVKLLLDRNCPRTELNRFGHTAYEEARSPEMKQLFERPESTGRFHELDAAHAIAVYLSEDNDRDTDPAVRETQDFIQIFKTDTEIFQHSLNQQTTAMWLEFYNWFSHTFRVIIEREDLHIDQFDLHNHGDFQQFLKCNISDPTRYQITIRSIKEAEQRKSIEPLITLYTNENAGFYRPFNQQLANSSNDAEKSPHLCDRFILEFHIHHRELEQRAFTGTVYRGATLRAADLIIYEHARFSDPPGVLGLKAFTSTSTDPLIALKFATKNPPTDNMKNVLFVFEVLKATPTIFGIEDVSQFIQEHEVLILPGNLFVVTDIKEDQGLQVTTIYLRHWNVPVSFWAKIKQTFRAGKTSAL